jgi:hypothetical protein
LWVALNPVADCIGFDWDDGNIGKNWTKHRVTDWECEEVFFNQPLAVGSVAIRGIHDSGAPDPTDISARHEWS